MTVPTDSLRQFFKPLFAALTIAAFSIITTVHASPVSADSLIEQQRAANKVGEIQQELAAIKREALQANPELQKQQLEFERAFENKANQLGYDPDAFLVRAKEIQSEIRSADIKQEKQQALIKEFNDAKAELAEQRHAIMSDPELNKMESSLRLATINAMTKQDPKTKALFDDLDRLIQQMR
ncbi:hypothetical protein A3K86_01935 [Photobacterium jeanii]|uniref:Uncharacterized protein n=1 Tax=Photobacterium jeanii TaxID=858640 RepID=A0A178KM05_9GAMM|nr:hypothetical protein [Photobacterium jeanii]OAN17703.1 hypothetical protein A3K86_01935 [Photobacterium jeanii]PST92638.1 hypothetical protein C9I91_05550 [Photobacterium jeanii]